LALAQHAPAEAVRHLELAEQLAQTHGVAIDSGLLTALAIAQQRSGQFVSAARTARAGLDRTTDPIERARLLRLIAQAKSTGWEGETEAENIQAALREIGRGPARRLSLLVISSLWTFLLGQLIRVTRIGYGTARGRPREVYRMEAALYAAALRTYAVQLKPLKALLSLLRNMYPVMRIGPGPELAQLRAGLGFVDLSIGLRRAGRRHAEQAVVLARATGDPTLIGLTAWMEAFNKHTFGIDQGEALRRVLDEHGQWLEVGMLSDLLLILLWDALHRGEVAEAQRLADQREALIGTTGEARGGATTRFQTATVVRAALAGLAAWQDRPEEAEALLADRHEKQGRRRWERLPLFGAAIVVAYQQSPLDERFDQIVAEFDALRLPSRTFLTVADGFYVYRARGRIEQYRRATGADRPHRRRLARTAFRLADSLATTSLLRAQVEVARAAFLQAAGKPKAALHHLERRRAMLLAVDAAWITFDANRVKAYAYRDLGATAAAAAHLQAALVLAGEHGWTHHARQLRADFAGGSE
jgi:hypothetical protein